MVAETATDRLAAVIRNVPGAIYRCRVDAQWTMEFISPEIERLSGHPASDFIGNHRRSFASIIHPADRSAVDAAVTAAVAQDRPFAPEYRIVRTDGAAVWVLERGQAVTDARGETWLDGIIFDISERKVLEEEVHRSVAQEALAEERLRLARELHDAVGHALSVAAVQAGAARAVLRTDLDGASRALDAVEGCIREGLVEMRQLVSGLHGRGVAAGHRGLARIEALVEQVVRAGLQVRLTAHGSERDVPVAVDVSLYRIAQESLTNCLKYAAGAEVEVIVSFEPDAVRLDIVDDGAGCAADVESSSGGAGLDGMRQRAAALGGEVVARPDPGGGFRVTATFPVVAGATRG